MREAIEQESPPGPSRGGRRRLRTREKLISAARTLMAEKDLEAASIQEITEAADVGFGSFYNHFATKRELAEAVRGDAVERFGQAADRLAGLCSDPAEVVAASIRHAVRFASSDSAWGRFLIRSGWGLGGWSAHPLGRRLRRDVSLGLESGRFTTVDERATLLGIGGTVMGFIGESLLGEIGADAEQRAASAALRMLGVPAVEAEEISRRDLPEIYF